MKLEYIFTTKDNEVRAKAVITALFENKQIKIEDYKGNNTLSISDQSPAFIVFDGEQTKHETIGWRLAAKDVGIQFFGEKPDVVAIGARANQIYQESASKQESPVISEKLDEKFNASVKSVSPNNFNNDKYNKKTNS